MSITASKYVNNSKKKTSYIGLFHYIRPVRGKGDIEMNMYGLLSVSSEVEIPGNKIAKFAWDGIIDGFEYSKSDSVNESLKLSLTEATRRIKQLITNDTNIAEHGVDINFTIFVSNNGGLYIGLLGDSDILVYKKGRLVDVYEMLSSKKAQTAGIAIEEGDLVFSSTKGFLGKNIKRLMNTKTKEELVSVLEELGREVGDDQGLVVLLKEKEGKKVSLIKSQKKEKVSEKPVKKSATSDYIPIVPSKEEIKKKEEEKDLKYFFSVLISKGSKFKTKIVDFVGPFTIKAKKHLKGLGDFLKKRFSNIKEKVLGLIGKKRWYKRVSSKVTQSGVLKKRESGFKEFRIDGYKQKQTKVKRFKTFFLVLLVLSLVVVGVKFTIDQKEAREVSKVANEIFVKAQQYIKEAETKVSTDKESSELNIFKASEELSKVPENLNEKDLEKYRDLERQVLGIEDTLYKRIRLSISDKSIEKYVDTLTIIGVDSRPSDIGMYRDGNGNQYLLITDLGLKAIHRISLYNKQVLKLPDDNKVLDKPAFVYVKTSGVYVLDSTNGVVKAEFEGNSFKSFTKLSGLSIQNLGATDIAEFAVLTENENVYVLDRAQKTLLRATNFGTGYGLSSPYLTKNAFENANDVLADLSVYILTPGENGTHRYVYSATEAKIVESPISIKGLDTPLKNPRYGYTADNLNKGLFIFDSEDKRILRLEKPVEMGEIRHPNELLLLNQYVFESDDNNVWSNVKDFVVDFKEEYLYLLDDTTVWKVRL